MIRAVLLLHKLLLCLSLRCNLFPFLLQLHQWPKGDPFNTTLIVLPSSILSKLTVSSSMMWRPLKINLKLETSSSSLLLYFIDPIDLGELGWWPYTEHHPKMGFVNYFQAYFLQWIGFVIIIISQSHMRMFILSDCVHLFWRRTKVISTKKFLWLVLNLIIWLFSSILLPP